MSQHTHGDAKRDAFHQNPERPSSQARRPGLAPSSLPFLLSGIAVGGALAYFYDPVRGARRRAEVRQQGVHLQKKTVRSGGRLLRDLLNRGRGLLHLARPSPSSASDEVVTQRIRSSLGRFVEDPKKVSVEVAEGMATLRGRVRAEELSLLLACVKQVKGVREVNHELTFFSEAGPVKTNYLH